MRQPTAEYHDFNVALADGFILPPGTECVQDPQAGVMGLHVINPARLMDPAINILEPEILLYVKRRKEFEMNMLDMQTREKANQIHINEMQQDAKARHMLRQAKQDQPMAGIAKRRTLQRTLAFAALIIVIGSFLLAMSL